MYVHKKQQNKRGCFSTSPFILHNRCSQVLQALNQLSEGSCKPLTAPATNLLQAASAFAAGTAVPLHYAGKALLR